MIKMPGIRPFKKASEFIARSFGNRQHDIALVLGSGLGGFTKHLTDKEILSTTEIPDYPRSTVPGHSGEIVSASVGKKRALVFGGRVHYYESASTVNAAVTAIVAGELGIPKIVLTNAAGILNEAFRPGDLMLIQDQLNLTFRNVLSDMRFPVANIRPLYSEELAQLALAAAVKSGVNLQSGTYVGLTGPSYETAAEVRFYRILGGDAIGMSTVHEAMYARAVGIDVAGISCLTNYSTGITSTKLSHDEVTEIGAMVDEKFSRLLSKFIDLL
ncbi:MAG: purine-nucleoside phosphorylase [Bacteroidetes bacterium]|nr:purine-nucleoside phosphorylase [Bacteroidota bacterium]